MLACIACSSKHTNGPVQNTMDEDDIPRSPATRETIRSLTNQLKGMAFRFSTGAYRHCKPCAPAAGFHEHDAHIIDSMDITDTSSDVSSTNTHNVGSFFSTPPQSFQAVFDRHARSSGRSGYGVSSVGTCQGPDAETEGTDCASQHGSKSEFDGATEDELEKEWVAQVEPGVLITFATLSDGRNDLKRIRFSREMFNKWQAQQWWAENCDKVHELYNVPKFSKLSGSLPISSGAEDELKGVLGACVRHEEAQGGDGIGKQGIDRRHNQQHQQDKQGQRSHHHIQDKKGRAELKGNNAEKDGDSEWQATTTEAEEEEEEEVVVDEEEGSGEMESKNMIDNRNSTEGRGRRRGRRKGEWVEEDDPGVYITLRSSPQGVRELKRVRFSREKFNELEARLWWRENQVRVYEQYL